MDDSNGSGVKPPGLPQRLPPLRIKSDLLKVRMLPHDDAGQKIEPEQQPAARVMTVDGGAPVNMRGNEKQIGQIPAQIIAETTALDAANAFRSKCFQCANFDQKAWAKLRLIWGNSSDPEIFKKLNGVRAFLLGCRNEEMMRRSIGRDEDFDVEHAIATQLGICQPLTEINGDGVIIVSAIGTCPDHVISPTNPLGLFEPKDRDHEKIGSQNFDKIMMMAAGKAPTQG
jgi:hypothetical protein